MLQKFRVLVGLLILLVLTKMVEAAQPAFQEPTVELVLMEVQKALVAAQVQLASEKLPDLDSVVLSLQTVATREVGGRFKFLIFSFGRKVERERCQLMELKLVPPKPSATLAAPPPSISEQLVAAIVTARRGVSDAENGTPPLELDTLKVELSFVVKESTGGGATFEILPVTAELSDELQKRAAHKIAITFKKEKESEKTPS